MYSGTINDITNLKFYSEAGYEIPMQKLYILTWEIIPGGLSTKYIKSNPSGYFIGDVDLSDRTNIKISDNSLIVGFINNGEIFVRYAEQYAIDENNKPIFSYDDDCYDDLKKETYTGEDLNDSLSLYYYIHDILFNIDNLVKISINIEGKEYSNNYNINEIFNNILPTKNFESYIYRKHVYVGNNVTDKEYFALLGINSLDLKLSSNNKPYILNVFESNVPNIGLYFPFIRYSGDFLLERISAGFIASNTIIILEENKDLQGNISYLKPYISSNNKYSLVFLPASNGELKLISSSQLYDVQFDNEKAFSLSDKETSSNYISPFTFAIGVQAEIEGAYQNFLGIYMRSIIEEDKDIIFFMGCIVIKTEVEGEDERFRTLLENFGIIDPIRYPNLFAEQDYLEEGKDFKIINQKSKELMLTYDQIFSYIGTYKALLKAIKFLGYTDIIFKEWYTIKDINDKETDIAVQVFDTESGIFLKQKLADYGVSIENFKSYNKINRLSMIYHLNEIDEDNYEYIDQRLVKYKKATYNIDGSILDPSTMVVFGLYKKLSEVPLTKPIYEYRNEETLAKLFGVKKWLEHNIIGVNAYISDISGEGIYFGWMKSLTYTTQHYLTDFSQEQYYTAVVKNVDEFKNSSININCTLNELNNGIKFCDYENTKIIEFYKMDSSINMMDTTDTSLDFNTIHISNTIESPVLGDEYEFNLLVKPDYGTLCEWTVDGSSQILYNNNQLNLLFDTYSEACIDSSCLPIITLEHANIHRCYGNWAKNIEWSIKELIDLSTGNIKYRLKNSGLYISDSYAAYDTNYFVLVPTHPNASIKYSENNKYKLPMFIIKGYEFDKNLNNIDDEHIYEYTLNNENEYILEILKGDILFKEVGNVGAQLSFCNDKNYVDSNNRDYSVNTYKLEIAIQYTFKSDKKPFSIINYNLIQKDIDSSTFDYSKELSDIVDSSIYINDYYLHIINEDKDYIKDINNNSELLAYKNALDYTKSKDFCDSINSFIDKKKEQRIKELLYNDYLKIYNNNYIFNNSISTNVNRLGSYNIICKAYDKYNNIFINKCDKMIDITAPLISIDLYVSLSLTNNDISFYRYNTSGTLCDSSTIIEILNNHDTLPKYPKTYHIHDFICNPSSNTIEFDNISYAIDTPKNNDYLILDNLTELCTGANVENNEKTKLKMLDENPNRIYLYNNNTKIKITVFDKLTQQDYINIGPYNIEYYFLKDSESDNSYLDDSYITIDSSLPENIIECINNANRYNTYILNVSEHTITPDNIYNIDYENKHTSIIFNDYYINDFITNDKIPYLIYNLNDVVKIRYYINDTNVINETTYRIIDIYKTLVYDNDSNSYYNQYVYVINGLINEILCDDIYNIKTVLTLANHKSVHYVTRVVNDAKEYNYEINYGNYIIHDKFQYDCNQMLLNDYIDNTYSGIIYDYDDFNLLKSWFDPNDVFDAENMELFYYHNHPITIKQGKQITLHHHDNHGILCPNYHVAWKISNYTFDDITNWYNHTNINDKEILFRSINNYLSFKPDFVGTHDIELECIDKYGNRIINSGSGLLYVTPSEDYKNTYQLKKELICVE